MGTGGGRRGWFGEGCAKEMEVIWSIESRRPGVLVVCRTFMKMRFQRESNTPGEGGRQSGVPEVK